ncbi:protein arginine N-methyltransferase 6 [Planococcus citri]|uniref:protein arginine N-methyltransferase 6 n=1 Tax=Planococcus citri TaxID=170843 RepID=UPI0031F8FC7E
MTETDEYFESYSDLEVHRVMLNDTPRNEAYRNAIFSSNDLFDGKTVLDVGTGTAILSILCAKAGARKVYAVDASNVVEIAKETVKENEVQHIVEVIRGRIEDIELPEKVDIIISEWMGFYLLHEAMLDSVLVARDKFLKPDGLMFPDKCELFASICSLPSLYSRWNNICDIKMNHFASHLRKLYNGKPEVTELPAQCLLSDPKILISFSLKDVQVEELNEFKCKFFTVSKSNDKCQGICIWFTVTFPSSNENEVVLDTSPTSPLTHWKQTVLVMQEEIELEEGQAFVGMLNLKKSQQNSRFYDIEFEMLDSEEEDHPVPCNCYFTRCKIINALSAQYDEQDEIEMDNCEEQD